VPSSHERCAILNSLECIVADVIILIHKLLHELVSEVVDWRQDDCRNDAQEKASRKRPLVPIVEVLRFRLEKSHGQYQRPDCRFFAVKHGVKCRLVFGKSLPEPCRDRRILLRSIPLLHQIALGQQPDEGSAERFCGGEGRRDVLVELLGKIDQCRKVVVVLLGLEDFAFELYDVRLGVLLPTTRLPPFLGLVSIFRSFPLRG
jgi:hypothetical protein